MGYTVPHRKRIGGELRKDVFSEVERAVEEVEEDCDVVTGSSDGWNNIANTHFLSQLGISRKGPFFKGAVDTTGVETMNKEWVFGQLENLMFMRIMCGVEKPIVEDNGEYDPTEEDILLLQRLAAIVLDAPNINKGAQGF